MKQHDPAVVAALSSALGPPPWDGTALGSVTGLDVEGASSLEGLSACRSLRSLTLSACDIEDLVDLAGLPIAELTVLGCSLGRLPTDLPLERLTIDGAALDRSQRVVLASLAASGVVVSCGDSSVLDYTCTLLSFGARLILRLLPDGRFVAIQPGAGAQAFVADPIPLLDAAREGRDLNEHLTPLTEIPRQIAQQAGNAAEAEGWIDGSSVPYRASLKHGLDGFPGQVFYRYPDGEPRFARVSGHLPDWWGEAMAALAGIGPVESTLVQFFAFPDLSADYIDQDWWYHWLSPPHPELLLSSERYGTLVPIAWEEGGRAALAVGRHPEICDGVVLVRIDEEGSGLIETRDIAQVFFTYSRIFSHLGAIRLLGQPPIQAEL